MNVGLLFQKLIKVMLLIVKKKVPHVDVKLQYARELNSQKALLNAWMNAEKDIQGSRIRFVLGCVIPRARSGEITQPRTSLIREPCT